MSATMNDATAPPPRSSSAAPTSDAGNRSDSSEGEGEGEFDTSLDQSFDSSAKEEDSGGSEVRAENKQKRKRTSPKDQAILEAEYKRNSKPNKAARAEIVEKVSLNEKEVQIWFQNRRQIDRRKSRPLLPHEIAAFGPGGIAALSSDPPSTSVFSSSQTVTEPGPSSQQERSSSESCQERVEVVEPKPAEEPVKVLEQAVEPLSEPASSLPAPLKRQASSGTTLAETSSFSITENVIKSFSSTPGYLANRWNSVNSSFSTPSSSQPAPLFTPPISQVSQPASCPERIDGTASTPASRIRLSLSLDGKAELVTSSPSPPQQHAPRPTSPSASSIPQKRMRTLQRSQSALPFGHRSSLSSAASAPFIPRLAAGRSRDARTWEFCCDGEVRDELMAQAENESHGSAVAAISLIRSASNSALKPNANKRNISAIKYDSAKHGKRPKLGRASSSVARLQNPGMVSSKENWESSGFGKDGLMRSPSGDSDKENWVPHEGGGNPRRRPLPSGRSDKQGSSPAVLGDNHNIPSHAVNLGRKNRKRADVEYSIFEDQENSVEVREEVANFMRGEVSPSKKGDLDCIQGLLSLSQGNWR